MWNTFLGITLLLVALAPAGARVNVSSLQPNRLTEGRPISRINHLKGSSSASSSTSISSPSPPKLRKQQHSTNIRKLPKEDNTVAGNPAMDLGGGGGGQTEDAGNGTNDAELEQICATATSDGGAAALTTNNNLSIQYEYAIFTDQADNVNSVLSLGDQVNLKVTENLQQLYILDFCLDYMGNTNNREMRRLTRRRLDAGDVRAVVPGNTALQADQTCEDADGAGVPCVYLTSSVTVHFATDYVIESADDVGNTILKDVERAFKDGLSVDANVAGMSFVGGSLGTVAEPAATNDNGADTGNTQNDNGGNGSANNAGADTGNTQTDNGDNGETDNGGNGETDNGGNVDGAEQGSTTSGTSASVEVEDKMSRAGKFFLTVFILGLVGALIYVCWKLRRVDKVGGDDRGAHSSRDGDFRDAITERMKHWRDRMQQWQHEASRCSDGSNERIKLADTEDDEEEDHLRTLPQVIAEVRHLQCRRCCNYIYLFAFPHVHQLIFSAKPSSYPQQLSERKTETKLKVKAKSWIANIKDSIFDSERAENIPRTSHLTSVRPTNSCKGEGFSIYGKEDEELPNFSFINGSNGHDASKLSHLFVTNTMDSSTTEGGGTEIILEELAEEESKEKKRSLIRKALPIKSEPKYDEYKQSETEHNISTWSYNTKNFSLSDIQILVDDADESSDASNFCTRRTYYMPDTVQL